MSGGSLIEYCYNTGDIIDGSGIVCDNRGTIRYCYNSGQVTGKKGIAGIAGGNMGSGEDKIALVENCYNLGTITGDENVGGIVGYNFGTVKLCHNIGNVIGNVTANKDIGGIIGRSQDISENCYWSKEATEKGVGINIYSQRMKDIIGLTSEQMKNQDSFSKLDFTDVWYMDEFPKLQNMHE